MPALFVFPPEYVKPKGKSAEDKPADDKPADDKSAEAKPVEANPVGDNPVGDKPGSANPADADHQASGAASSSSEHEHLNTKPKHEDAAANPTHHCACDKCGCGAAVRQKGAFCTGCLMRCPKPKRDWRKLLKSFFAIRSKKSGAGWERLEE